jgi:hypothetical protein
MTSPSAKGREPTLSGNDRWDTHPWPVVAMRSRPQRRFAVPGGPTDEKRWRCDSRGRAHAWEGMPRILSMTPRPVKRTRTIAPEFSQAQAGSPGVFRLCAGRFGAYSRLETF